MRYREARNKAAHEVEQIDQATAEDIVEKVSQILGSIHEDAPDQYLDSISYPDAGVYRPGHGFGEVTPLGKGGTRAPEPKARSSPRRGLLMTQDPVVRKHRVGSSPTSGTTS